MLCILIVECFGTLSPLNLVPKVSAALVSGLLGSYAHKMLSKGPGSFEGA